MAIISVVGGISDLSPADYRLNLRQEHAASFPAWTALAVGFWGWAYMKGQLERPSTLIRYTLWWRALPIVLIIIVLVVTTVIGSYIFEFCSRRQAELPNRTLVDTDQSSQALLGSDLVQIHETAQGGQQTGPPLFRSTDKDLVTGPALQTGKPDLVALVRSMAASVPSQRERSRLVVAACGPVGLVEAARHAVASVRSEGCHAKICFSGTDSTW